jgi:hypothetical protein
MVLTTLLVRLQQTIGCTVGESVLFYWKRLGRLILLLSLIVGCSTEGDISGTGLADPGNGNGHAYGLNRGAEVSLSPSGLAFSATVGGNNPTPQTVTVSNSGTGTLNWSIGTGAGWLSLSTASGTAPSSFTVTPNIAGLAAGTYSTTIDVSDDTGSNSTQSIPVDLTILPASASSNPPPPSTVSVFLSWNPVQDSSVTGYYVHFGMQSPRSAGSCTYTQSTFYSVSSLSNKSAPLVSVSGLVSNTTYYFAVSAYNGRESTCSNEVSTFTQSI